MKHPIAFKCFVLAAILAANGCTYDNLDKLNPVCSKDDCQKAPENAYIANVSGTKDNCVCEYQCKQGFVDTGSGSLECVNKNDLCNNTQCKADVGYLSEIFVEDNQCKCKYKCDEENGYRNIGTEGDRLVCKSCEDICNAPIDPDNHKGVVVDESKWESGECSCKYACDEEHGFEMAADSGYTLAKIRCEQNKCFEECSGRINENTPGVVVSGSKMVGEQCNCEYSCDSQNKYEKVDGDSRIPVCAPCGNELCMKRLEGKQNVVVDFEWNSENNSCNCNYSCSEDYHPENNNVTDANINCISCLDGENCGNERYCCENSAWNCTSGMCFDQKNIGEECYNNAQCKTGTCDASKNECIESRACTDEECCQKIGQHWSGSKCVECLEHEQCGQDRFCKNHICTLKYNVGATCDGFEGIECKSGMCVESSPGSGTSVCACDDGANQCGSGKVCLNQLCVPGNVAVGSDCIDTKQCVRGSICDGKCKCETEVCCVTNDGGKHWSTKQKVCVQKLIADDSCVFGDFCGNDLYCSNDSKTCKNKLLGGENCKDGSSDNNKACMSNSCSNSICKCNSSVNCKDGNKVCSDNGLCVECTESKPCDGSKYCDSNNTCKAKKDNGKTCSKDYECKSDHCNGATCVECTQSKPCSDSNKYCDVNSTCQTKKPNGQECADNKECSSGICNGGKCAECNTDNQCKDKYGTTKPYCSIELGLCVQKKIGDDPCNNKSECSSNKCISGVCGCSNQSDCVRTDYMCHDSRCILRRSLLGGELCKNANACKSGQCLQGYDGETRCRCSADANGIVAECKGELDLVCNTYTAAGECRSDCYGACVPKYSLELGEECASNEVCNTNYCYFDGNDFLGRCACINGSFDYIGDVVQYCRNYTYTNDLWYYNYLLGYECPSENAFALKYASRNASSLEASFEDIIGNPAWCELVKQYLDGTVEAMEVYSPGNFEIEPMCLAYGNKAFELNTYSGDLHLNSCQYGCNTGFTACHENIRSSCASHELDMLLYVDIVNILTWTEDSINIDLRGIDNNKGQLCYNDLMLRIYSCALNIPEIVTDIAGSCRFELNGASSSSYDICIDFYNKDTYEKRSYFFNVNGGGGESSAKYCPRGCNVDYSGCNDL